MGENTELYPVKSTSMAPAMGIPVEEGITM